MISLEHVDAALIPDREADRTLWVADRLSGAEAASMLWLPTDEDPGLLIAQQRGKVTVNESSHRLVQIKTAHELGALGLQPALSAVGLHTHMETAVDPDSTLETTFGLMTIPTKDEFCDRGTRFLHATHPEKDGCDPLQFAPYQKGGTNEYSAREYAAAMAKNTLLIGNLHDIVDHGTAALGLTPAVVAMASAAGYYHLENRASSDNCWFRTASLDDFLCAGETGINATALLQICRDMRNENLEPGFYNLLPKGSDNRTSAYLTAIREHVRTMPFRAAAAGLLAATT